MTEVRPFRALHYDRAAVPDVVAPPYDVIDAAQRADLKARSPHNVVEIDLPQGEDPYGHAATTFARWRAEDVLRRDAEPAFWVLTQDYTGPDGKPYTRSGFFARVRVEEYGPGRIRPHERTHPGPKEDRLNLTRATRANLSPIFVLHGGPMPVAVPDAEPWAEVTDADGTTHRLWRVGAAEGFDVGELLIADGHHRYETARVYADEVGGEGPHRYVLACLVSLEDPGLTVFPTHRLLTEPHPGLLDALGADWEVEDVDADDLEPESAARPVELGFTDGERAVRLRLRDQATADAALPDASEAYRTLDTAVLEALVLKGSLGMSEDDISHFNGLDYSRSFAEARARIASGEIAAGFFMGATPVAHIRDVAAAGEVMPPKSTYFFPKVLTGLVLHPLDEE